MRSIPERLTIITINHLLTVGGEGDDIAVLVNDVGEVNVDADLIENGSELSMEDGGVTELSNGCICCGLQNELNQEVILDHYRNPRRWGCLSPVTFSHTGENTSCGDKLTFDLRLAEDGKTIPVRVRSG